MSEDKGIYGGITLNKKELETRAALQTTREELHRAQVSNNRLEIENNQLKELIRAYKELENIVRSMPDAMLAEDDPVSGSRYRWWHNEVGPALDGVDKWRNNE